MPLFIAPKHVPLEILAVRGDFKTLKRLQSLGIIKGNTMTLIRCENGATVVSVKDARYMLDRQTSSMIEVNPVDD